MIITQTPLRISFFGGGSDFQEFYRHEEGCVLSSAIDKYIYVIVKKRFDQMIRVSYTHTEMVSSIDDLQHELIRESCRIAGVYNQIEISTLGDIPSEGSGLGSSSTVTVGVLNALYHYMNNPRNLPELALRACKIEIEMLGKPIGKQDQYIAAFGGLRFIRFLPLGRVEVESVNIGDDEICYFNQQLMLFNTNMTRKAESVLKEQIGNISDHMGEYRVLKEMAIQAKGLLESGRFDDFGRLLHESWMVKKGLASKISNPDIDEIYKRAIEAGALGGKLSGAGGGGFLLLYCPVDKQANVKKALEGLHELPFRLEPSPSKVIFNYQQERICPVTDKRSWYDN